MPTFSADLKLSLKVLHSPMQGGSVIRYIFKQSSLTLALAAIMLFGIESVQAGEIRRGNSKNLQSMSSGTTNEDTYTPPSLPTVQPTSPETSYGYAGGGSKAQTDQEKIPDLAKSADQKTQIIKLASLAAAGFMTYQCVSGWPASMAQCAIAGLMWSQFAQIQSHQTKSQPITSDIAKQTTTKDTSPELASVKEDPNIIKTAEKIKSDLLKKGIKLDGGKVTLPNGQQFSSGALASKGAAQGAGIDGGAYDQAMNKFSEAKAEASRNAEQNGHGIASKGGSDSGVGGGFSARRPVEFTEEPTGGSWSGQNVDEVKKRGLASLAGASKKMGQDNIGIAADNIFQMVQRRYDKKRQQKSFLER